MTEASALVWLLIITVILSVLLLLASQAAVGRKVAELEYLLETGQNGVDKIQATINIRTHVNRVFFGITFLVAGVLYFIPMDPFLKAWIDRVLLIGTLSSFTVSSLLDWRDERRQVRIILRSKNRLKEQQPEARREARDAAKAQLDAVGGHDDAAGGSHLAPGDEPGGHADRSGVCG